MSRYYQHAVRLARFYPIESLDQYKRTNLCTLIVQRVRVARRVLASIPVELEDLAELL